MNEDREVIGMVQGNLDRIEQRRAVKESCKARKKAEKRRLEQVASRLLWNCLPAGVVILGCDMAVDGGLLAPELGTPAVLLAVLYIGICLGRFSKEVR